MIIRSSSNSGYKKFFIIFLSMLIIFIILFLAYDYFKQSSSTFTRVTQYTKTPNTLKTSFSGTQFKDLLFDNNIIILNSFPSDDVVISETTSEIVLSTSQKQFLNVQINVMLKGLAGTNNEFEGKLFVNGEEYNPFPTFRQIISSGITYNLNLIGIVNVTTPITTINLKIKLLDSVVTPVDILALEYTSNIF